MRGQPELLLQVLGQEGVHAADGHQVQHRAGRAPHQDVIGELTLYCGEEVCNGEGGLVASRLGIVLALPFYGIIIAMEGK